MEQSKVCVAGLSLMLDMLMPCKGILAAAAAYTLTCTLVNLCLRSKHAPGWLRWLLVALDVLFIGAFIAVAALTRPNGKSSI